MVDIEERTPDRKAIRVHCPSCSNSRLFDLTGDCSGILWIKCPRCRKEVEIQLAHCNEQRYRKQIFYYRTHKR